MDDWNLDGQMTIAGLALSERKPEHVLVEYDGPQVVTQIDHDGRRHIGVLADVHDDGSHRWVYAPLTQLEFQALCTGAQTVREAIKKPLVEIVDTDASGHPRFVWARSGEELPERALPDYGSYLPTRVREYLRKLLPREEPIRVVAIDGPNLADHAIPFDVLGGFLEKFQSFYRALSERLRRPFYAPDYDVVSVEASPAPGSVRLKIKPGDEAVYDAAIEAYRDALSAADSRMVEPLFDKLGADAATTYSEYLGYIERHRIEVLVRSGDRYAFVGMNSAPRFRETVEALASSEEPTPAPIMVRGTFAGFNYHNPHGVEFDFHVPGSGWHRGTLDPSLRRAFNQGQAVSVVVGTNVRYEALIIPAHGNRKARLLRFQQIES